MKRRRKRRPTGSIVLVISTILLMSLLGVSYAYWNESLDIFVNVYTGSFDIKFGDNAFFETISGTGDLTVKRVSNNHILLTGTVEEGLLVVSDENRTVVNSVYQNYNGVLNFEIINDGSIPAKFYCTDSNVALDYNIIQPNGGSSPGKMTFDAGEGTYDFKIELLLEQGVN